MAQLPTIQPRGAVTRGPQSSLSAAEIANPYQQVAEAFGVASRVYAEKENDDARIAGQAAVVRDANGNLQVDLHPNWSERDRIYNKYAMMDFTAKSELDARETVARLQQEAKGDPMAFDASWKAYRDQRLISAPSKELRAPLTTILDREGQMGRVGVMDQKFRSDMAMAKANVLSSIEMKQDEMAALARQGGTGTDAYKARQAEVRTLYGQLTENPISPISQQEAEMRIAKSEGRDTAEAILGQADRAIQTGGILQAQKLADRLLSDETIPLSPAERRQYAGLVGQAITGFKSEQRANLAPLKEEAKEWRKKWEQGVGFDDVAGDDLISAIARNGDLSSAQELSSYRKLQRTIASYKQLGNADQVAILENAVGNANRPAAGRSRPVSVSPDAAGRMSDAMKHLVGRGLTPVMAAGVVGNLMQESGLNSVARNPGDGTDGSDSIGIAQWNADRARALKAFAASRNASPDDLSTQLDFIVHELETTENATYQRLKAATNVDEAAAAFIGFERPVGWSAANPRGGHGWDNRYSMAVKAAEAQGLAGELLGVTRQAGVPAELIKQYQNEVKSDLQAAKADWKTQLGQGNIPDQEALGLLTRQLALVDDQNLRQEYAQIFRENEAFQRAYEANPADAESFLSSLEAGTKDGASLAELQILDAFKRGREAQRRALDEDPIGYAVRRGLTPAPPPLDMSQPETWGKTFQSLQRGVDILQARGEVGNISALRPEMLKQVTQSLASATPQQSVQLLGAMAANLRPEIYKATLGKLYASGDGKAAATAGALVQENPLVAESVLRGQLLLRENPMLAPKRSDANRMALDNLLPPAAMAPGVEGARQMLLESATARYADLAQQSGDASGELNDTRMEQAIKEVTGGVLDMNGHPVIAPRYGMTQDDFDKKLSSLTDQDLEGAITSTGRPVRARDLVNEGRLRAVADGRYLLEFGRSDAPTYVMQRPSQGNYHQSAFILDLRDR